MESDPIENHAAYYTLTPLDNNFAILVVLTTSTIAITATTTIRTYHRIVTFTAKLQLS